MTLQICRNGKIQLNYEWSWWWPQRFGVYRWFNNMAIIAPFWATADEYIAFKAGYSKVYYHVYEQVRQTTVESLTSEVLTMASEHVQRYGKSGKFANFRATWVLVVTWENLCPYVYYLYLYSLYCPGVSVNMSFAWRNKTARLTRTTHNLSGTESITCTLKSFQTI